MSKGHEQIEKNSREPVTPNKEHIHRAAAILEIWVVPEGRFPQVYITLVHKKSKNWWETPGGQIKGNEFSRVYIKSRALIETDQEASTNQEPFFTQSILLGEDPTMRSIQWGLLPAKGGIPPVQSHPIVIRQAYRELPEIILGKASDPPEMREMDDYALLNITKLYFDYENLMCNRIKNNLNFALLKSITEGEAVKFIKLSQNPRILIMGPISHYGRYINLSYFPEEEEINLSTVSAATLLTYFGALFKLHKEKPFSADGTPTGNNIDSL